MKRIVVGISGASGAIYGIRLLQILRATVAPVPAFYHQPCTLEEVIDQTVNRALDLLGVELAHDLFPRWAGTVSADYPPSVVEI
jgi:flavin prenyltransferase